MRRFLVILAVATMLAIAALLGKNALSSARALAAAPPPAKGYWHTHGVWIVDNAGHHVRIAAVNWYGMNTYNYVPAGLDLQRYTTILKEVKRLGFNTIRLLLSDELVARNPVVHNGLRANPDLVGLHALTVLDRIVAAAGKLGLRIVLVNHRSAAGTPHTINFLNEPLWYTAAYPESVWIADWVKLAKRYKGNPTIVGFDLRNEPHTNGPGPWSLTTYLHQGATWGPYRGKDDPATDWRLAAERAGNAVLSINPRLLIIVEGVMQWPDPLYASGVETYWWGSIFKGVRQYPVQLNVPHQLVYSPHEWGPRKDVTLGIKELSYASLSQMLQNNWAFILNPRASYVTPIWIGEFGTCNTALTCVGGTWRQGKWFQSFIRYLKLHPYIGWSFFALNGTNAKNNPADNGLLDPTWTRVQLPALMQALRSIEAPHA